MNVPVASSDVLGDLPVHPPHSVGRGVMVQRWDDLAFISWAFDPQTVERLLPTGLEVDTFDGPGG